jgi:hypothetical protein
MRKIFVFLLFCCFICCLDDAFAQDLKTNVTNNKELDSLRKKEESAGDSVVFNSKYIRYTTLRLTKDSIQTLPIDTGLTGIQNFSIIIQPRTPRISTGVLGLPTMPLLFEPAKTIGFDAGFHSLEAYALTPDDIKYYRARTPYTNLYYVSGSDKEQILKITHSQNIKKNWNIGANFNRIGANGDYTHQRGDHLNGVFFTWYQSNNKRYNLWANTIFNTLKANENGSIVKEDIFEDTAGSLVDKKAESIRLTTARQFWRENTIMLKQSYFVGRIDSTNTTTSQSILPTNKITHTLTYNKNFYTFKKDEADPYLVLPKLAIDSVFTNDSTSVRHLQNEFVYSFFLRAKGSSIIKNELKITAGIRHDMYDYEQTGKYRDSTYFYRYTSSFQNVTVLGSLGYRLSNRADLNVDLQQIVQGRHAGDFLYEAKSNVLLSNKAGRIVLGTYLQNKSPEEIYIRYFGNHYNWDFSKEFDRTKTANLSFTYLNDRYNIDASANYYLITNHLYFEGDTLLKSNIRPAQESDAISLLKISVGKKFTFRSFHLDSYVVYQKTDHTDILRTPVFYTFNSIYKEQTFFKAFKTQIGVDIRYNSTYNALSYSPAASQFYNGNIVKLGSKPVIDVWVKAGLRRANLFLKYDYANQGLFNGGFYTVNRYPMPDKILKFGVSWSFYD